MTNKIYFVGAGPGDPKLLTLKGKELIEQAKAILYTGSLVPKGLLKWAGALCIIRSSFKMSYEEIYEFLEENVKKGIVVRLHTGDPSLYSTIAKQINHLKNKNIGYEVVPGVTSASGAASLLNIEYTLPHTSQTLILTRIEGKTKNPEKLSTILSCKNSSIVFYLSIQLLNKLKDEALRLGYSAKTPCWVVEKATWEEGQRVLKGTLDTIENKVKELNIKGLALILFGNYLNQEEGGASHLYNEEKINAQNTQNTKDSNNNN